MAKFEEAYSTEFEQVIDAEKAYELFWEGTIEDKRAFECPDPNCNARITCVNIDKKRSVMKQIPHFNCYGEHDEKCNVFKGLKEIEDKKNCGKRKKLLRYIDTENDIFSFTRPKRDRIITKTKESKSLKTHKEIKQKIEENYKNTGSRSTMYYSIKPLISKFEKYLEENTLGKHYITIKGNKVSYKRMFVDIENKKFEEIEKYYRIYYGKGKIHRSKSKPGDFVAFFTHGFRNENIKTMIYIRNSTIEKSYMKNKWREELNYLVDNQELKVKFYVNCKPSNNGKIITLFLNDLDYFDYRIIQ